MSDGYTKHLKELELDLKPEVQYAIDVITSVPECSSAAISNMENMSMEQLEATILSLSQDHHKAATLKRKGYSYQEIANQLHLKSSLHAQRMVTQVLNVGYHLSVQDKEILRAQCLDELDDMTRSLWAGAEAAGRDYLDVKEVKANLGVISKKIDILGVSAPVEVSVDVSARVKEATDRLQGILNNVKSAQSIHDSLRSEGLIIDGEIVADENDINANKFKQHLTDEY